MTRTLGALFVCVTLAMGLSGSASTAPGQRVDLKVLLLSADGNEPSYEAWRVALQREGVPFDTIIATQAAPITAATLAEGTTRARYQAVVLATGALVYYNGTTYASSLSDSEWAALRSFERSFGIRQVSAFVYPAPEYGLNYPIFAGDMGGVVGSLTPAGQSTFPYLVGTVPIDRFAYGYQATPIGPNFKTLVGGPNGSALAGVYTHPDDGREELVVTVDGNSAQLHSQLLRHGLLNWVTRGVYLGHERNYLELHVDDVFIETERWDTVTNTTPDPSPRPIRMTSADVSRAVEWSGASGIKLDMVFNAEGAISTDPLTTALLANKNKFGWINHTWSHPNLDNATLAVIKSEIQKNINWASGRVSINKRELVTGEHSGLANPNMPQALRDTGIRSIAADNSRQPEQYQLGPALTVPRHPTNVYYNVATRAEQLDEYNYVYLPPPDGSCVSSPTNTCRSQPATWDEYVASEATIMFRHLTGNDPRPHYVHQANLAEDRVLYTVVDEVLRRYRSYFRPALVQLSQTNAGQALLRSQNWKSAQSAGQVTAYLSYGKVYVQTTATTEVPLTGTSVGEAYGGQRSGWATVAAGPPVAFSIADPSNTSPPTVSGNAWEGQTLTAGSGSWSGTAPITYAYQWQRCDAAGADCVSTAGATSQTYAVTAADIGSRLRVVVTASNSVSSVNSANSAPTAVVTAAPVAPSNTAAPTVSGTPQQGQTLTAASGSWSGTAPTIAPPVPSRISPMQAHR